MRFELTLREGEDYEAKLAAVPYGSREILLFGKIPHGGFDKLPESVCSIILTNAWYREGDASKLAQGFSGISQNVEQINFSTISIKASSAEQIIIILKAIPQQIRLLKLIGADFGLRPIEEIIEIFSSLPRDLAVLSMGGNELGRKSGLELKEAFSKLPPHLHRFEISANELGRLSTQELIEAFSALPPDLAELDFGNNNLIGSRSIDDLKQIFAALPKRLRSIKLEQRGELSSEILLEILRGAVPEQIQEIDFGWMGDNASPELIRMQEESGYRRSIRFGYNKIPEVLPSSMEDIFQFVDDNADIQRQVTSPQEARPLSILSEKSVSTSYEEGIAELFAQFDARLPTSPVENPGSPLSFSSSSTEEPEAIVRSADDKHPDLDAPRDDFQEIKTTIYCAPKPRYSRWEWFKFIAIRIIFPPVLLWDLVKFGVNKWLGEWVGRMVLPAQEDHSNCLDIITSAISDDKKGEFLFEKHDVVTHDGIHLDTFEIQHQSLEQVDPKYQKYIINLCGNGTRYESVLEEMKQDARKLKANVVGFNLRGVGESTGTAKSKTDLVTDGIAQVQRLIDKGVSPQNITLRGHSLGGGLATLVVRHFHQLGQPINLYNSRSFSSITNFLVGHLFAEGSRISIWLVKPLIKFVVTLTKWEINAGSAFRSIPEAYREYIVVRSRKETRQNHIDDTVIRHYASIHKALTSERQHKKALIDKEIKKIERLIQKANPAVQSELTKEKERLVKVREAIKSDRKMEGLRDSGNAHVVPETHLKNRSGKSAQTFFLEFVRRAEEDHGVKCESKIT